MRAGDLQKTDARRRELDASLAGRVRSCAPKCMHLCVFMCLCMSECVLLEKKVVAPRAIEDEKLLFSFAFFFKILQSLHS